MISKLLRAIGIIGFLLAAEGATRFGGLVSAFRGADAPFYQVFMIVAAAGAGLLLVSFFASIGAVLKYSTVVVVMVVLILLLQAPAFPVVTQMVTGFIAGIIGIFGIRRGDSGRDSRVYETAQKGIGGVDD